MLLPQYSPEMNLNDGLWGWIKSIINNIFYSSLNRVRNAVKKFIKNINMITK